MDHCRAALCAFTAIAVAFRLYMLLVSRRHEAALRRDGCVEYGQRNSDLLAAMHTAFYAAAVVEAVLRGIRPDAISLIGAGIWSASAAALVWIVALLGPLWTVRLIVARNHTLVTHWLFRIVRHPNYLLNILPELVGLSVALHAWFALIVGLPFYAVLLTRRIAMEERVMRARFGNY